MSLIPLNEDIFSSLPQMECQTQDIHTCYMKGLFWQCLGNTDNHSTSRRAPCCELFRRGGMTFFLPCRPLRVSHGMKLSSSIYRYEISHADYLIKHLVTLAFSSMGDLLTDMVCFLINLSLSLSLWAAPWAICSRETLESPLYGSAAPFVA